MAKETTKPAFYKQWLAAIRPIQKVFGHLGSEQDEWAPGQMGPGQWVREMIVRDPFVLESFRISTLNDVSKSNTEGGKTYKHSLSKCGIKSGKIFSLSIPTCQKLFFFQTFSAWKT